MILARSCYNNGNTVTLLKSLQELRGLFTHYSNCNPVWKTLAQPIDALLGYPDGSSMWIRCEEVEPWRAFWNVIQFNKQMLDMPDGIENLFTGRLLDLMPDHIRMSGPTIRERVLWFSGDATSTRVACINWTTKQFTRCPVSGFLDPFLPRNQQSIIIADVELLAIVLSAVIWGETGEGVVHIEVTDNLNALSWMSRKRGKRGIALKLLSTFSKWIVLKRFRMVTLYSRTYHNVSADALARSKVSVIEEWDSKEGFKRIEPAQVWFEFRPTVLPGELVAHCDPICFSPRTDLNLYDVEWNPINYQVCETMEKFGIRPSHVCARHLFVGNIAFDYGIPRWGEAL